ncbi:MAG: hypothetical protein AVDCRST_MAG73-1858 [uncultured Thermomicrobiales bacterium]|uniref:Uncharacterized protein n=1 Tax=uncultured Thermomicrobiales bacterium TaxID=1645740 RepID=A0A6J4U745_9BACT|nr:MAG: hypothetical protein AVDCRST_MAG73-1858 [uncultured Thermomicrobiales bacterium]
MKSPYPPNPPSPDRGGKGGAEGGDVHPSTSNDVRGPARRCLDRATD